MCIWSSLSTCKAVESLNSWNHIGTQSYSHFGDAARPSGYCSIVVSNQFQNEYDVLYTILVVVICLMLPVFPRGVIVACVVNVSGLQYMSLPTIFRWATVCVLPGIKTTTYGHTCQWLHRR